MHLFENPLTGEDIPILRLRVCKNYIRGICDLSEVTEGDFVISEFQKLNQDECILVHPEFGVNCRFGSALCCLHFILGECEYDPCRRLHRTKEQIEEKMETYLYDKEHVSMGRMFIRLGFKLVFRTKIMVDTFMFQLGTYKFESLISTPLKRCQFQSLQNLHQPISPIQRSNEDREIILLKQRILDLEEILECKNEYILELLGLVRAISGNGSLFHLFANHKKTISILMT